MDKDEIYVYCVRLPPGIKEMVTPCLDGYTIYIDERLDDLSKRNAYYHALSHIINHDFEKTNVQGIESTAHERREK